MKYVVSWVVTKTVPAPCPDFVPDPYTGELPAFHCAVYHTQNIVEVKSKTFETEEEAIAFANNAPSSCNSFLLNGVVMEDKREKETTFTISDSLTGTLGHTSTVTGTASINMV